MPQNYHLTFGIEQNMLIERYIWCMLHINGFEQDYDNSIATALGLLQSSTKPTIYGMRYIVFTQYCWDSITNALELPQFCVKPTIYEVRYNISGLILGLLPANERPSLHSNAVSHWLGATLESALYLLRWPQQAMLRFFQLWILIVTVCR